MATLKPFRAVRPKTDEAKQVCSLPYDVMNTEEARQMAEGNPLSFLRVTRAEIEMGDDVDPYGSDVYQKGAENLQKLIKEGHLVQEDENVYILYRLIMGDHQQLGLVAVASCEEYDNGTVRKHELTRPDKEDDRTRHIELLGAQTGSVFLTYHADPEIDSFLEGLTKAKPDIDFVAEDGVAHTAWIVREPDNVSRISGHFAKVPALYVADGHHRTAAASRVAQKRKAENPNHSGDESYNYFLAVTFPHDQVKILGYNRAVKDLNGLPPEEFLTRIEGLAEIEDAPADHLPRRKGEATMYLDGKWRLLRWKNEVVPQDDAVGSLDVSVLQDQVLDPLLGIENPRTDKRISFVGGIRGTQELERLVDSGDYAVAFALYPTALEDLMTISDEGGLMPPKSTWFEPKLRDAMAVHLI